MPQPYHGFDIDKARSRPYRPFRWAYHQTMCMLSFKESERKTTHQTNTFISNREDGYRLVDRARGYLQNTTRPTQRTIRQARKESPRLPPRVRISLQKNSWKWSCNMSARGIRSTFPWWTRGSSRAESSTRNRTSGPNTPLRF